MSVRPIAASTGALVLATTVGLSAAPARADVLRMSVSASGCTVTVRNTGTAEATVRMTAPLGSVVLAAGQSRRFTSVPGGGQNWTAQELGGRTVIRGWVRVPGCPGVPATRADGDENGDGRADLLAVQAGTGDLYYYPMTANGLGRGRRVGTGWNAMVFLGRASWVGEETFGTRIPAGRSVVAVHRDSVQSVWRYLAPGDGRVVGGWRHAVVNARELDRFSVLPGNEVQSMGSASLLGGSTIAPQLMREELSLRFSVSPALAGDWRDVTHTIGMRDFDGDHWADVLSVHKDGTLRAQGTWYDAHGGLPRLTPPVVIGHGWGAMDLVCSPGSLDGDGLSDIVARRKDGNLYLYRNHGGRLGAPQLIGRHWNGIRLLA